MKLRMVYVQNRPVYITIMGVILLTCVFISSVDGNLLCQKGNGTPNVKSIAMAYMIPWTGLWNSGRNMGPAILPALENIREKELIPGYDIKIYWADTEFDQLIGMQKLMDIWVENDIDVIIGDGCSTLCIPFSMLASTWNIPIVSWACSALSLSQKHIHNTFSRVVSSGSRTSIYTEIIKSFNWKKVAIITDNTEVHASSAESFFFWISKQNMTTSYHKISFTEHQFQRHLHFEQLRHIIQSLAKEITVIVTFIYSLDLENILQICYEEEVMDGLAILAGEVFDPFSPKISLFESILTVDVSVSLSEKWNNFAPQVINNFQHPQFEQMNGFPPPSDIGQVSFYAGEYQILFSAKAL